MITATGSHDIQNTAQQAFWSGGPGEAWVAHQAQLDELHAPVSDRLIRAAAPGPGERVLDIGCGAGATCLLAGPLTAPDGQVLGLDISTPLVTLARKRIAAAGLENVTVELADAQTRPAGDVAFDLAISRFGLMFFEDPVAGFRNIAGLLRPRARLVFACWAPVEHNPWFGLPMRAAVARLGPPEPSDPDAPGPLAFRDRTRVAGILEAAGFWAVQSRAVDLDLPLAGGLEAAVDLFRHVGPVSRHLRDKGGDAADLAAILDGVRELLAPFAGPDGIRVPARINLFEARSA